MKTIDITQREEEASTKECAAEREALREAKARTGSWQWHFSPCVQESASSVEKGGGHLHSTAGSVYSLFVSSNGGHQSRGLTLKPSVSFPGPYI